MFALGFEKQTNEFLHSIKKSWGIAFFGALAPFCSAFAVADYFWDETNISLMCGLTMVSLKSEGLSRSPASTRIMTSAVLDDIASLALVAILVPIAADDTTLSLNDVPLTVLKAVAFFVLVTVAGGWLLPSNPPGWFSRVPVLGRFGIQHLLAFGRGQYAFLAILLLALLVDLAAHEVGFHPAVGAYMAGLILRDEYFHTGTTEGPMAKSSAPLM